MILWNNETCPFYVEWICNQCIICWSKLMIFSIGVKPIKKMLIPLHMMVWNNETCSYQCLINGSNLLISFYVEWICNQCIICWSKLLISSTDVKAIKMCWSLSYYGLKPWNMFILFRINLLSMYNTLIQSINI